MIGDLCRVVKGELFVIALGLEGSYNSNPLVIHICLGHGSCLGHEACSRGSVEYWPPRYVYELCVGYMFE